MLWSELIHVSRGGRLNHMVRTVVRSLTAPRALQPSIVKGQAVKKWCSLHSSNHSIMATVPREWAVKTCCESRIYQLYLYHGYLAGRWTWVSRARVIYPDHWSVVSVNTCIQCSGDKREARCFIPYSLHGLQCMVIGGEERESNAVVKPRKPTVYWNGLKEEWKVNEKIKAKR